MALPNARNQYLKTQVETASKEQLVVMLFDGIIRFTEQARKAIREEQIEASHHALMRAQAIIMELICTIDKDKGGDVAKNLMGLHAYAFNCLIVCNMKKDITQIDEVQKIYRELRDAWTGAMDSLGISSNAGKPLEAPAPAAAAPAGAPAAPPQPAVPSAAVPAAAAPVPAAPAVNGAAGYGMGRTAAMLGAMKPAAAAAAGQPAPAATAQQAAMMSAYAAGRSIA